MLVIINSSGIGNHMLLHTGLAIGVLCVELFSIHPRHQLMETVSSELNGGIIIRKLMPSAVVLPLILGLLILQGEKANYYGCDIGFLLMGISQIVILAIVIWVNANYIDKINANREQAQLTPQNGKNDDKSSTSHVLQSEESYRILADQVPLFVWTADIDGNITYQNQRWFDYSGLTKETSLGSRWLDAVHPDDKDEAVARWTTAVKSGKPLQQIQYRLRRHDGVYRWHVGDAVALYDEHNNITKWLGSCTDIDDRVQAEISLLEANQQLQLFVSSNVIGILFGDIYGGIKLANDAFLNIIGYTREDLEAGRIRWTDITPPEFLPLDDRHIAEAQEKGTCVPYEKEYLRKDGKRIQVLVGYALAGSKREQSVAFILDITDRKQAEIERDRYFNISLDILSIAGIDGYFKHINPSCEKILGYTPEEMLIQPYIDFIHPDDRDKTLQVASTLASGTPITNFENRYLCKDGTYKWLLWNSVPVIEEEIIYGVARDITERKLAEEKMREQAEALRVSRERLDMVIEAADIGLWFCNLPLDKLHWNNQCKKHFGLLPDDEVDIELFYQRLHPQDREPTRLAVDNCLKHGNAYNIDYRTVSPDGHIRWIQAIGKTSYNLAGEATSFNGITIDISQRKQAEARILELNASLEERVKQRTAQLVGANKELESFSYSVSHDLRAPLRHIAGFIDLLQKRLKNTELDETSRRYLNTINESSKQAGKLIDDLLAFSRMGRAEMRLVQTDMNLLVEEVKCDLYPDIKNRQINWHIEELPTIPGDTSMLRLVWRNLIENALKYSKTRSVAEICIGYIVSDIAQTPSPTPQEIVFYIKDNGIGFDMRYAHKLFGVFQRLHSDPRFEGTGVGLANIQRIIHRHGGRVWAEAELHKGATFYFALPTEIEIRSGE